MTKERPVIGSLVLGDPRDGVRFYQTYKPHWFHLLMLRLVFGIHWTDDT